MDTSLKDPASGEAGQLDVFLARASKAQGFLIFNALPSSGENYCLLQIIPVEIPNEKFFKSYELISIRYRYLGKVANFTEA